jgi:hypothetical protein
MAASSSPRAMRKSSSRYGGNSALQVAIDLAREEAAAFASAQFACWALQSISYPDNVRISKRSPRASEELVQTRFRAARPASFRE